MKFVVLFIIIFILINKLVKLCTKNNIKSTFGPDIVIPKVINKIFIQHSGDLTNSFETPRIKEVHNEWIRMNPGYKIKYWSLNDCRNFLNTKFPPEYLKAFDSLTAYAAKADFVRYCIIYVYGGWYSDWKEQCMVPGLLDELASDKTEFIFFESDPSRQFAGCVQNCFFGSIPRNPILGDLIQHCLKNIKNKYYGPNSLSTVGPCALGKVIFNPNKKYNLKTKKGIYTRYTSDNKLVPGGHLIYDHQIVNIHKCDNCGGDKNKDVQKWIKGNNYNVLWNQRKFFK